MAPSTAEVQVMPAHTRGAESILARLPYGTGLHPIEGLAVRVQDIDFGRLALVPRSNMDDKDHVVMLPRALVPASPQRLADARGRQGAADCDARVACV